MTVTAGAGWDLFAYADADWDAAWHWWQVDGMDGEKRKYLRTYEMSVCIGKAGSLKGGKASTGDRCGSRAGSAAEGAGGCVGAGKGLDCCLPFPFNLPPSLSPLPRRAEGGGGGKGRSEQGGFGRILSSPLPHSCARSKPFSVPPVSMCASFTLTLPCPALLCPMPALIDFCVRVDVHAGSAQSPSPPPPAAAPPPWDPLSSPPQPSLPHHQSHHQHPPSHPLPPPLQPSLVL